MELSSGKNNTVNLVKLIALFGVMLGATSGVIVKVVTAPSPVIVFYRLAIAVPVFAVPVLTKHRDELKNIGFRELFLSAIAGTALYFHLSLWFVSVKLTTISSAATVQSLHPLFVALVSIFIFKIKVSGKEIISIIFALTGAALVAGVDYGNLGSSFSGDIIAFASGICIGVNFLVGNVVRKKLSSPVYLFVAFCFCLICSGIQTALEGYSLVGYPAEDYIRIVVLALVCQIASHGIYSFSLGYVSSLFMSSAMTTSIAISSIYALIFYGEIPTSSQAIGIVMVLAGLLLYNRFSSKREQKSV